MQTFFILIHMPQIGGICHDMRHRRVHGIYPVCKSAQNGQQSAGDLSIPYLLRDCDGFNRKPSFGFPQLPARLDWLYQLLYDLLYWGNGQDFCGTMIRDCIAGTSPCKVCQCKWRFHAQLTQDFSHQQERIFVRPSHIKAGMSPAKAL